MTDFLSDSAVNDSLVELNLTMSLSSEENNDTIVSSVQDIYCGSGWKAFGNIYGDIHGYTSILVCVFGCLANLLNLIVLTRKGMISATNAILTGLALADMLNMIEYIPYSFYMYIWKATGNARKTYGWALFVLVHSNFAQVCHTVAIWLTVTLAVWRYIMVVMPLRSKMLCTMERAKWAIASAYFFSLVLCTPLYLSFSIREQAANETNAFYIVHYSTLALANQEALRKTNFWIYSVVIKLIPCIALTVVSLRLVNSLMEAKKRKDKLMAKRAAAGRPAGSAPATETNESGSDRTTRMLLAVLLLFLITEFPQGILGLLSGVLGDQFFKSCYIPAGDIMDFTALLNSAINFILYCVMSKKFRETFSQVFHLKSISSCCTRSSSPLNSNNTHSSCISTSKAQITTNV